MKGKLNLYERDKNNILKISNCICKENLNYDISSIYYNKKYDYEINFYVNPKDSFEKNIDYIINNDVFFNDFMNLFFKQKDNDNNFNCDFISKEKELIEKAELIHFHFSSKKVVEYIKNNKIFKNKYIIVNEEFIYNRELFEKLKNSLDGNLDNVYFQILHNGEIISYKDCIELINGLDNISKRVELYNFSPIEKIMYVYDFVRSIDFELDENQSKSNKLSNILKLYKNKSVAYSNLFYNILKNLDICIERYAIYNKDGSYARTRNYIYVKDDKYRLDGGYFFDIELDSKKSVNDYEYLNSYKYFCKTKSYFDKYDEENNLEDRILMKFNNDLAQNVINILKSGTLEQKNKCVDYICFLCRLTYNKNILPSNVNLNEYLSNLYVLDLDRIIFKIIKYFIKDISSDLFFNLIRNVREYQYYENPKMFDSSLNNIYNIMYNSDFEYERYSLKKIKRENGEITLDDLIQCYESDIKEKFINRYNLIKSLRKICEKKETLNE